jgi:DNA-binding transcriptional LysR family regulator
MTIDQKRLHDLLAIARHGSFGRAAQALGVSQPALSTSIGLLENTVGGAVLVRDRKGARPTALGDILIQHARTLELLIERATAETKTFLSDVAGPLAIGASPVAAASIVPAAILRLRESLPRSAVTIVEGVDDNLIERLKSGEIDLMISPLSGVQLPPGIDETPLNHGQMTIVMRPSHALARKRHLTFEQLTDAEWVLPLPGNALRRRLEARFLLAGIRFPAHTIATNSISGIKLLVRNSGCVAIMARAMAEPELASGQLVALPIADEWFNQTLGLKRWQHHPLSPIAARFVEIVREIAGAATSRRDGKKGEARKPAPVARKRHAVQRR